MTRAIEATAAAAPTPSFFERPGVQQVILPPGKAGGHGTMAGGQVPLSAGQDYRAAAQEIEKRFLDLVGETSDGVPLLA